MPLFTVVCYSDFSYILSESCFIVIIKVSSPHHQPPKKSDLIGHLFGLDANSLLAVCFLMVGWAFLEDFFMQYNTSKSEPLESDHFIISCDNKLKNDFH